MTAEYAIFYATEASPFEAIADAEAREVDLDELDARAAHHEAVVAMDSTFAGSPSVDAESVW